MEEHVGESPGKLQKEFPELLDALPMELLEQFPEELIKNSGENPKGFFRFLFLC